MPNFTPSFASLPESPDTAALRIKGAQEIRLFGLSEYENTAGLVAFFSQRASVHGVLLHSTLDGKQWAQLWVPTEDDVEKCLEARAQLESSGVTMTRIPPQPVTPSPTPFSQPRYSPTKSDFPPLFGPLPTADYSQTAFGRTGQLLPPRFQPERYTASGRSDVGGIEYRRLDTRAALPRNLYIVDLPVDMTEVQFSMLFERFGTIEHCKLLSQLDGMGRRRGFILMSTHREAADIMRQMHGCMIEGRRMDVSWALVQREAKQFGTGIGAMPNRVIHPPVHPLRREVLPCAAVIVEGLEDSDCFPSSSTIRALFSTFGPIQQCNILNAHAEAGLTALIQYEQAASADLLVQSSGMTLGSKQISVRPFAPLPPAFSAGGEQSDPFGAASQPRFFQAQDRFHIPAAANPFTHLTQDLPYPAYTYPHTLQSRLDATSSPFVPHSRDTSTSLDQDATMIDLSQSQTRSRKTPSASDSASHEPKSSPSGCQSGSTRFSSDPTRNDADLRVLSEKSVYAQPVPTPTPTPTPMLHTRDRPATGSKMHDRWLSAGMKHGDGKWFKSTAWCELAFLHSVQSLWNQRSELT